MTENTGITSRGQAIPRLVVKILLADSVYNSVYNEAPRGLNLSLTIHTASKEGAWTHRAEFIQPEHQ